MIPLCDQLIVNLKFVRRLVSRSAEMESGMRHLDITVAVRRNARELRRAGAATSIAAIVGLAALVGTPAAQAQTLTWGLFQENLPASAVNQTGNCWTQAMVSGDTINGALLAGQLTKLQAREALASAIRQGTCPNQATDDDDYQHSGARHHSEGDYKQD
jgi:hypothetical protein